MKNSSNYQFSEIFMTIRAYHGLGQTELAQRIGCSQSTISKIENSQLHPDLVLWFDFLREFEITNSDCFYSGLVSLKESSFRQLFEDGSRLAPDIDFSRNHKLISSEEFKRLTTEHPRSTEKKLLNFLKSKNINPYILSISNHPIPFSLIKELNFIS